MEYKEAKAILNQFGFSWIKCNSAARYFQPFDEMYDTRVTALEIAQAGDPEALKQTCRAKLQKLIDQLRVLQGGEMTKEHEICFCNGSKIHLCKEEARQVWAAASEYHWRGFDHWWEERNSTLKDPEPIQSSGGWKLATVQIGGEEDKE